ncbi:MAG: thiamine diphosphokinase [Spirochaetales bacterium]
MLGVVFTGGLGPSLQEVREYIHRATWIVAADSGLLLAERMGVKPQVIIGDMDSLPSSYLSDRYKDVEVLQYPEEKDDTDTELALKLIRSRGCDESVIIGGGGGRLDHLLGLVSLFYRTNPPNRWFTHQEEVVLISEFQEILGRVGQIVSFMPVGLEVCRMKTTGLRWPLDSLVWKPGDIGIHNILVLDRATVTMIQGKLLMILPKGEIK